MTRRTEDSLEQTLRRLQAEAQEAVASLEHTMEQARAYADALRLAASTNDVSAIVTNPLTDGLVLLDLLPHLGAEHVEVLMLRGRTEAMDRLLSARVQLAVERGASEGRDVITAIATTPVWPGDLRVRLLTYSQPEDVLDQVAAIAAADPRLSVLFGLHLSRRQFGWTTAPSLGRVRRRLRRGRHGDLYRLGCGFRGGMRDPRLEWDLVELLATMPAADVAARMVEEMPPVVTDSAAAVARRLADLDVLVCAVTQSPPGLVAG